MNSGYEFESRSIIRFNRPKFGALPNAAYQADGRPQAMNKPAAFQIELTPVGSGGSNAIAIK